MRRIAVLSAATLLTAIILAPRAEAQGFAVYEHDACAMARGGAGVAAPCPGGSAVFFNPAGILSAGKPWNIQAGLTLIAPKGSFLDSASQVKTSLLKNAYPVPSGYITRQLGQKFAVGFGAFAPYGLTTEWPVGFQGRYLGYSTTLASIYFQPTVAYQVAPGIQVGLGVDYVTSSAQVHRRLDASTLPVPGQVFTMASLGVPVGTDFADVLFDVTGTGWGWHLGAMWQATSNLTVGVRFMSQVKVDFTGNARFTPTLTGLTLPAGNPFGVPGGTSLDAILASKFFSDSLLGQQDASTSITMPYQIVVGVAYKATSRLTVLADYQFTNWNSFETLNLTLARAPSIAEYEHFKATSAIRAGVDWQAMDGLQVRAGFLAHNGASPAETVTPILPEGKRMEGTLGAGIALAPSVRLDLAYQYIRQETRRGRLVDAPTPTPALNHGVFAFTANLFGASLALAF
jgi:long-chain fatty acid transport protein